MEVTVDTADFAVVDNSFEGTTDDEASACCVVLVTVNTSDVVVVSTGSDVASEDEVSVFCAMVVTVDILDGVVVYPGSDVTTEDTVSDVWLVPSIIIVVCVLIGLLATSVEILTGVYSVVTSDGSVSVMLIVACSVLIVVSWGSLAEPEN